MADAGEAIADAVVAYVNDSARDYPMKFEASNPENPDRNINVAGAEVPKELTVFFVPVTEVREAIDGAAIKRTHAINGFVSRLRDDEVTRKVLNNFVNKLVESLDFVEMDGNCWEGTEIITKYDAAKLRTDNHFLSVFRLSYYDVE